MEVGSPAFPNMGFDFNISRSSPSTPRRFGDQCFFSAPASPSRMSEFYREFDTFCNDIDGHSSSGCNLAIPFNWEEKPGTPKSPRLPTSNTIDDDDDKLGDDFTFDFSAALEKTSLSAEELFDGGKIKRLKPPPRLQVDDNYNNNNNNLQIKSPLLSQGKKIIRQAFSPRNKNNNKGNNRLDPFTTAIEKSRTRNNKTEHERGRCRSNDNSSRRRSVSPCRGVSGYPWEDELMTSPTKQSSTWNSKPSLKWRLRDFFLFRSASEGRATDKDPFRKYSNSSTDGNGSGGSNRRKVSAHELHYTKNKEVSDNMKRKTLLPYKQGILGRLPF